MKYGLWIILFIVPLHGHSSWCPYVVINRQFDIADIVIVGKVENITIDSIEIKTTDSLGSVISIEKHGIERATIKIENIYKGEVSGQVTFTWTYFSEYPFRTGEKYLIFGRKLKDDKFITNWCNGTVKLTDAKQAINWLDQRQSKSEQGKFINADNNDMQTDILKIEIKDSGLLSITQDSVKKVGLYKLKKDKIVIKFINYDKGRLYKLEDRKVIKLNPITADILLINLDGKEIRLMKRAPTTCLRYGRSTG